MSKFVVIALIAVSPVAAASQRTSAEDEVRAFVARYDKAVASRDTLYLQSVYPADYVFTGASGTKSDREQVLKWSAQQRRNPSHNVVSLKHENVVVRVSGAMAVVTNDYTSQTLPIGAIDAEPQTAKGRHTGVFEKRNGRWMVIAEQDTEQMHDPDLMETQVAKAGRDYYGLTRRLRSGQAYAEPQKSRDTGALARLYTKDYTCTCADEEIIPHAQTSSLSVADGISLQSADVVSQRVLAIDNNAAVETGAVRYVGVKAGVPIDITVNYSTIWVSWANAWQIISRHSSVLRN
jgi:ketosteroid isomerase-like protein